MVPATGDVGLNDFVIWFNGGPGCSSLSGILGEEGPVKMDPVTYVAKPNPYSWTNLTNIMWVDQPAGTGFSRGPALNQSMEQVALDFNGFLLNLYKDFPKLRGKNLWLMGESFAGKFIPYIAHQIYKNEKENKLAGIHLKGIGMNDAFFYDNMIGKELPAVQFAQQNAKIMNLNQSDVDQLIRQGKEIGIDTYVEDNLKYPPAGPFHVPEQFNSSKSVYSSMKKMAKKANPCFSPFNILGPSPCPLDALGMDSTTEVSHKYNYFNRNPRVKTLIHADNVTYTECTQKKPFDIMKHSKTEFPVNTILPTVVEKSERTVVQHGTYDYIMLPNGTALAIQNMTWAGHQGFQTRPNQTLLVEGQPAGTFHAERKLTLVMVDKASHMIPVYKPKAAYKLLQYTLGQISEEQLSAQGL